MNEGVSRPICLDFGWDEKLIPLGVEHIHPC